MGLPVRHAGIAVGRDLPASHSHGYNEVAH